MSLQEDEQERQFQADLEKAIALSLETSEFERLRIEQRKKSLIESSGWRNRPTANVTPLPFSPSSNNVTPLPPPPSSSARRHSNQTDSADLISFHSPTKPEDSKPLSARDLEQFFIAPPTANQPALLPFPVHKTEQLEIGFKRDVLLRQNPFPQPAPILNFGNDSLNLQRSQSGSYSPYYNNFTPIRAIDKCVPSYPPPAYSYVSPNHNQTPSLYPSLSFPPTSQPQQIPYQPNQTRPQSSPNTNIDINALYSQPIKKTSQGSPNFTNIQPLPKSLGKRDDQNLIDLVPEKTVDESFTVLEAFDPLAPAVITDDGSSIYGTYDPFDYMAGGSSQGEAVYAEEEKKEEETVTVAKEQITADWIRKSLVFDSSRVVRPQIISSNKGPKAIIERVSPWAGNEQLEAFCKMLTDLRCSFTADDTVTNPGLLLSPTVDCEMRSGVNVKLVVTHPAARSAVTFTCDLRTSVEHVTSHVVYELETELNGAAANDYMLKLDGASEYLASSSLLGQYEYVYQCIKMDRDVLLTLVPQAALKRSLARTSQDDKSDVPLLPKDILTSHINQQPISFETLSILLDTVEKEMERLTVAARQLSDGSVAPRFSPKGVEQAVKALCSVMGHLETVEISHALQELTRAFDIAPRPVTVLDDRGSYSTVSVDQTMSRCCEAVREAVHSLIHSYCGAFNVDFKLAGAYSTDETDETRSIETLTDPFLLYVGALLRPSASWRYHRYLIEAQIYHGTRAIRAPYRSSQSSMTRSFYDRVTFNMWMSLDDVSLCMLPREARLVLAVFGLQSLPPEHELSKMSPGVQQYEKIELGWTAVQCFDHKGLLAQGRLLLSVWPVEADKRMGPAPEPGIHPLSMHPVLEVALPSYAPRPMFLPPAIASFPDSPDLNSLDPHTQEMLLDVCQDSTFANTGAGEREILWEKRHYLVKIPEALPKVLLAATAWDAASIPDLHGLLRQWSTMPPLAALQLLLPCFPDIAVRSLAISCIRELSPDELVDYLPQLVQALKSETYEANPLSKYLIEQALTSPRVAHHLFWLLVQILPGDNPQNSMESDVDPDNPESIAEYRHHWRLKVLLRGLLTVVGSAMRVRLCSQLELDKALFNAAHRVKDSKESLRIRSLLEELNMLNGMLHDAPSGLPLSASVSVRGIQVRTCSFFSSKTLPLKIDFLSDEGRLVPAIFKVGDDLRQDALTLQMIRVMDKLWLKEGIDLRMVTFACVPTGKIRGMIEMVTEADTLRKIQTEHGLTGSFKDRPIAEWLAKHNPGALEYARAVKNFTVSCAGYSVATYVLGICDRHNDNIMLNTTGHLFHIDFGKFLGDAQMFGNFKRDRAPFVLTSDMAYVINGGDRPAESFQQFVDLCCQAFHVVRQHSNVILNLLGFMVGAGMPGVTLSSMRYVQRALLPGKSHAEASAFFSRLIESALSSWFTQFNFFLHNLSQLRASGDRDGGGDMLSFVPKKHTCEEDGRIIGTQVHNVQKRYGTEKHYVYVIKVEREGEAGPSYIFRTYREFCELHNKICALFPLANVYSLQPGLHIGRSAVKQVAERRKVDIEKFLVSLFKLADEVAHSDIVYTFFHPLLRDQEDVSINQRKVKDAKSEEAASHTLSGQLKLSLIYQRGTFSVMVAHARGLARVGGGQEPSTYVKVYLLPDPSKFTKRKTKVVRRNCHPTFMEMLEYRLDLEVLKTRLLQVTVWSYDSLQENEFLGGVQLSLRDFTRNQEVSDWYNLGMVPR